MILRGRVNALASNENCRTIAFHNRDFVSALIGDKQEHDTDLSWVPGSLTWDGDTVTVVNSDLYCIEALLVLLRAPVTVAVSCHPASPHSTSWPRLIHHEAPAQNAEGADKRQEGGCRA